jgi:hypothetical protein
MFHMDDCSQQQSAVRRDGGEGPLAEFNYPQKRRKATKTAFSARSTKTDFRILSGQAEFERQLINEDLPCSLQIISRIPRHWRLVVLQGHWRDLGVDAST